MDQKELQCIKAANEYKKSRLVRFGLLFHILPPPKEKAFYCLWKKYGLDKNFDPDLRIDLLKQWVSILYAKMDVNIDEVIKQKRHERSEYYHKVAKDGGSVSFKDLIDSVISDHLNYYYD